MLLLGSFLVFRLLPPKSAVWRVPGKLLFSDESYCASGVSTMLFDFIYSL